MAMTTNEMTSLAALREGGKVPPQLRPSHYFDFEAHDFAHASLISNCQDVIEVLLKLHDHIVEWLHGRAPTAHAWNVWRADLDWKASHCSCESPRVASCVVSSAFHPESVRGPAGQEDGKDDAPHTLYLSPGVQVLGGHFDLTKGSIFLGEGTSVEPGVTIKGPAIIGKRCELRSGAYLRGDVLIGDGCVLRGEIKHSLAMDGSELAHPGYLGDSILGYKAHFGCQALTANLPLMGSGGVCVSIDGRNYDLGRRKVGAIMGDECQLGCNSAALDARHLGAAESRLYTNAPVSCSCRPQRWNPCAVPQHCPQFRQNVCRLRRSSRL
eukprot:TRINITY_DN10556_c0_g1_i1.p1 TRINITY_DN10556_c0_g1~~TRINITY_DN10556_c0_g1_i1.p1  ORF type:complete len:334 (+),score=44.28 TRINITY_DN10556_c0_g1_i1:30-1004(+)